MKVSVKRPSPFSNERAGRHILSQEAILIEENVFDMSEMVTAKLNQLKVDLDFPKIMCNIS